ncbi:alpha/beta hydrolase [Thermoplasmatales archaeon AK]|nr:alpha/beta hydrolase [Thermoplasmatales archaeon AK]
MIAALNGIEIYYEISGNGEPLVLVEGLGYSSWMWEFQRSLSRHLKLVIYDNRGVGKSSKPESAYTMNDFVNDLLGLVDHIGLDSFFLLGASMGGMIAQEFSLRHAERVKGLILSSTNFGIRSKQPSVQILKILATNPSEMSIYERMSPAFSKQTLRSRRDLVEKVIHLRLASNERVMQLQQIGAVLNFDSYDRLKMLKIPVLILTGEDDSVVSPENSSLIHGLLASSRLVKFRSAGHLVNIERSDDYNGQILTFIKQVSSGNFIPQKDEVVI